MPNRMLFHCHLVFLLFLNPVPLFFGFPSGMKEKQLTMAIWRVSGQLRVRCFAHRFVLIRVSLM